MYSSGAHPPNGGFSSFSGFGGGKFIALVFKSMRRTHSTLNGVRLWLDIVDDLKALLQQIMGSELIGNC